MTREQIIAAAKKLLEESTPEEREAILAEMVKDYCCLLRGCFRPEPPGYTCHCMNDD